MSVRRCISVGLVASFVVLGACQAVAPALTTLGLAFGQDLLAAASVNYTPRYAVQVEQLLVALAQQMTRMQFQPQLAAAGYVPPPPVYAAQNRYGQNPYGQSTYGQGTSAQDPYGQSQSPYGQTTQDPYGQSQNPYGQSQNPYGQTQNPYGTVQTPPYVASSQNPYGNTSPNAVYGQSGSVDPNNPYGANPHPSQAPNDPYAIQSPYGASGGYGNAPADPYAQAQSQPMPANPYGYAVRGIEPVVVSIDLLAKRAGARDEPLETLEDGATLRDGRGNPAAGDRLKVRFTANCACWVYVIGIDATGYVAQIFPDVDGGTGNPVEPNREYLLPAADEWWALDDQRGVEQIHVVGAYVQRTDIEDALGALAVQPHTATRGYRPVAELADIPTTRGLVKIKDATPVEAVAGAQTIVPTSFLGRADEIGIVASRWFRHE